MDRSLGFGSTPRYYSPYSDSLSLRLPYSVKLATERKSLTHYTKGTQSPLLQTPSGRSRRVAYRLLTSRRSLLAHVAPFQSGSHPPASKQTRHLFHSFLITFESHRFAMLLERTSKTLEAGAPTVCMHAVSGSISLPSRGSFRLSLTVLVHYRSATSI